MSVFLAAVLGTSFALTAASPKLSWKHLSPPQREETLKSWASLPLAERLRKVSEAYLGTPYVSSPLGEGEGVDPDPTFRLDSVDCLTFVEQTLAQSLTCDFGAVPPLLEKIRYSKGRSYEGRNHLMEAQWLPHNVEQGVLRDVTEQYGGKDAVVISKVVTEQSWRSASSRALHLSAEWQPKGQFPLTIIPIEKAFSHLGGVEEGTLLLVVREDLPFKVTRVTHLGFLFREKGKLFLRHAAKNVFGRVVDEDIRHFLFRNSRYEKWRVSGFALYQILDSRS